MRCTTPSGVLTTLPAPPAACGSGAKGTSRQKGYRSDGARWLRQTGMPWPFFHLREDAMHSFLRKRNLLFTGLFALAVAALAPSTATAAGAKPKPGATKSGFRLFARSLGALTINRVLCGLATTGEVCVDSTNSSTIGGGFWPKGTADQYVFNSGLQLAGIIGADANPEWAGDTHGASFFHPKGTTQHGEQVEPIYNSTNPEDAAFVSDPTGTCNDVCKAAKVPSGDANQD